MPERFRPDTKILRHCFTSSITYVLVIGGKAITPPRLCRLRAFLTASPARGLALGETLALSAPFPFFKPFGRLRRTRVEAPGLRSLRDGPAFFGLALVIAVTGSESLNALGFPRTFLREWPGLDL